MAAQVGWRRVYVVGLTLALVLGTAAQGQDARSLAMGGVLVPGPGAADRNPAFAAVPGATGSSFALPLGLAFALTGAEWDPASPDFDALGLIDRAAHLDQFLLNPARDPADIVLRVDADGLLIDVLGGSGLRLAEGGRFGSSFAVPVAASFGPLRFAVRPYAQVSGRFEPDAGFRRAFGTGADRAAARLVADADAGVALDLAGALPLPFPPELLGGGALYAGGRLSGMLGLARVRFDATAELEAERDPSGARTGRVLHRYDATLSRGGGMLGGGLGFGVAADLGLVVVTPSDTGTLTLGLAVEDLGVMRWTVDRTRYQGSQAGSTSSDLGPAVLLDVAPHLRLSGSAALELSPLQLGVPGMGLLLASDLGYAVDGGVTVHAGAEATLGIVAARAGIGLDDGVRLGVGAGVRAGGIGLDVALSSHRSPFTTHQAYGIAAGIAFGY